MESSQFQNKKGVLAVVLIAVILIGFIAIRYGIPHFGRIFSGSGSGSDNYNKTAWKFANLVSAGVLYPVERVIDGDTIVVGVSGHDITVRLIGADTPEVVDPRKPVQCYGPEASAEAKRIFGERYGVATTTGVFVYLEKDPAKGDYDKYGRLLAYIRLPAAIASTTDIYNEYMIMQGFAHEYTYFKEPYKYQAQFRADEAAAKAAGVGLWGKCP